MTNKFDDNTTPFGLMPKEDQEELMVLYEEGKLWR